MDIHPADPRTMPTTRATSSIHPHPQERLLVEQTIPCTKRAQKSAERPINDQHCQQEYRQHRKEYGYLMRMGSHVFFNGMEVGETNKINIEDGKTLVIKYLGLGDLNEDGTRNVKFELNGMRREVAVQDKTAIASVKQVTLADPEDKSQVGASIPGAVTRVDVKPGDKVVENQVIAVVEAMKMETSIVARIDGVVDEILVKPGQTVVAGELLATIKV